MQIPAKRESQAASLGASRAGQSPSVQLDPQPAHRRENRGNRSCTRPTGTNLYQLFAAQYNIGMLFRRLKPVPVFFLARAHGLAYLQMPKVACTSLRAEIAVLNRPELKPQLLEDGRRVHWNPEWNDMTGAGDPALRHLFRFTFVRHPVERFMSMYRNKILQQSQVGGVPETMARQGAYAGMPISELLDILEKLKPLEVDPHAVPQSWLLFHRGRSRADFVGRLERLSHGLEVIEQRTGIRLAVAHHNRTSAVPGTVPTPEEMKRIERFYAEDFERLGYRRSATAHAFRWSRLRSFLHRKPIAMDFGAPAVAKADLSLGIAS